MPFAQLNNFPFKWAAKGGRENLNCGPLKTQQLQLSLGCFNQHHVAILGAFMAVAEFCSFQKNTIDIRQPCPENVKIVTLHPYSTKRSPNFEEDSTTTMRKRNNALIGWMSLHGETSPAQRGVVYVQITCCIEVLEWGPMFA